MSQPKTKTARPKARVRVATLTLSDTRTPADDESGRLLGELLTEAGHEVVSHQILREQPKMLREVLLHGLCAVDVCDAVVITGGSGIAPRDRTIEAVEPLFQKTLAGFGEAFRRLSWDEIGPKAVLSRATAGVLRGRIVIALPGSPAAVRLAVDKIIGPMLAHAVELASGRKAGHG